MGKFTCSKCGEILINRLHSCGVLDTMHHVEIVGGGNSWGRMGVGCGRDYNNE